MSTSTLVHVVGLRRWRHLAEFTQAELARRARLTPQAISDLERGVRTPNLTTARRLVQVLKAPSIEALFPDIDDARGV